MHVHKVPSTRDRPERAMVGGLEELCGMAGLATSDVTGVFHGTTIATNAVLEHDGAGRRDDHLARLPRRRPHRAPPAAAALLGDAGHPVAGPAARAAPPPQGRERAGRAADRRGARAARRGRGARRRARAARRGRRGGRGLLPLLVPQPGARAARGGDRARGDARRVRHDERRHRPAVPRVRALHDGDDQRVRRPEDRQLPRPPRGRARRAGRRRRAARDDVERRRRAASMPRRSGPSRCCSPGPRPGSSAGSGPGRSPIAAA